MSEYKLYEGDCLQVMAGMDAGSVDAIVTDPPYGTTACKWDTIIPFDDMWSGIKHVRKPRAAVVLFGSEPFSSLLRVSNLKEYKYDWVWEKNKHSNFLNGKIQPLKQHETISAFFMHNYYPQKIERKDKERAKYAYKDNGKRDGVGDFSDGTRYTPDKMKRLPSSIIKFNVSRGLHPTQKPVPLMEYLIKTYTNEGDTVLDFTMGSGSTGVAAMRTGRKFIGIEQDAEYFAIAQERIANAAGDYVTTPAEKERGQIALWDM